LQDGAGAFVELAGWCRSLRRGCRIDREGAVVMGCSGDGDDESLEDRGRRKGDDM